MTRELKDAIEQLRNHQTQLDADGIMVGVSREALDMALDALSAPKAEAEEPYGYVYEERTPPRFTFSKTRIAIRPEDANEYELSETPVYTSPVPALTDEAVEQLREDLRLVLIRQPFTENNDTYSDGFVRGLAFAIGKIDALLAAFPSKGEGE